MMTAERCTDTLCPERASCFRYRRLPVPGVTAGTFKYDRGCSDFQHIERVDVFSVEVADGLNGVRHKPQES